MMGAEGFGRRKYSYWLLTTDYCLLIHGEVTGGRVNGSTPLRLRRGGRLPVRGLRGRAPAAAPLRVHGEAGAPCSRRGARLAHTGGRRPRLLRLRLLRRALLAGGDARPRRESEAERRAAPRPRRAHL